MTTDKFKQKIQSLVESAIKSNGEFKLGTEIVKKETLSHIRLIEPFHIDENGEIQFTGFCIYEQDGIRERNCTFEGKAKLSDLFIILDKQPITIKIR